MNQEIRKIKEKAYYHTKIKDWPEEERPREKLIKHGPQSLSDAELLALLIGSGTDGVTAVDLAKRFMVEHRNLVGLASMSIRDMVRMKGIGPARGARLLAAFEMGKRVEMGTYTKRKKIDTPEDLARAYLPQYRDLKQEVFCVILLDSGNRILQDVQISRGTLNASIVHPREVFKTAIDFTAAGIVLLHNHPSGVPVPSKEDHKITMQLKEASKILEIPILDHIILAKDTFYSFAQEGVL